MEAAGADEVAKLKETETKLQLRVQEAQRRENVLNMRLATKQQETQEIMVGVHLLGDMVGVHPLGDMVGVHPLGDMVGVHPLVDMVGVHPLGDMVGVHPLGDNGRCTSTRR